MKDSFTTTVCYASFIDIMSSHTVPTYTCNKKVAYSPKATEASNLKLDSIALADIYVELQEEGEVEQRQVKSSNSWDSIEEKELVTL